jgi:UDP:flavonoid glycosyltransferase YjiC (YdhE family)
MMAAVGGQSHLLDMSRVLFVSELAPGYGRIAAALPVAMALRERGQKIMFAVRDLTAAEWLLTPHDIGAVQAPIRVLHDDSPVEPRAYPDVLSRYGYLDVGGLEALVMGWRTLLQEFAPDLLVVNHSPTALVASRGLALPRVVLGDGFASPPRTTPLPGFSPGPEASLPALAEAEARIVDSINAVLASVDAPRITSLADLFGVDEDFLCTFPELDHYPGRSAPHYWGPLFAGREGSVPAWSGRGGPRIFAYVGPNHPQFDTIMRALVEVSCPVLIHAPGAASAIMRRYRSPGLSVAAEPVQMARAIEESEVVVCHAGHGTVAVALLGGRPLVLLPRSAEQTLTAANIVRLGAGKTVAEGDGAPSMKRQLLAVVEDSRYAQRSHEFREHHRAFSREEQIQSITARCAELLAGR